MSQGFDIVLDAVGKTSKATAEKVFNKNGTFVSVKMLTSEKKEDLLEIKQMAERGEIKPYIDQKYNLDKIVAAHTYVEKGHKRGNVVLVIEHSATEIKGEFS